MATVQESIFQRVKRVARNQGVESLVRQIFKFVHSRTVGRLGMRGGYDRFKSRAAEIVSLDEALEFAYNFKYLGLSIQPWQEKDEISRFMRLVKERNPHAIAEIGAGFGGTLFLFTRAAAPDAVIISLDLPPIFAGKGPPAWKDDLFLSFARDQQQIHLVRRNSHDASALQEMRRLLAGRQLDVLFIDADHSYDGVKMDYEMYSPLVTEGGMIVFHDIDQNHWNPEVQVPRFWRELKGNRKNLELSIGSKGNGIGILFK